LQLKGGRKILSEKAETARDEESKHRGSSPYIHLCSQRGLQLKGGRKILSEKAETARDEESKHRGSDVQLNL
jgi:hypothetical protein